MIANYQIVKTICADDEKFSKIQTGEKMVQKYIYLYNQPVALYIIKICSFSSKQGSHVLLHNA